jgi:hypothetical protein
MIPQSSFIDRAQPVDDTKQFEKEVSQDFAKAGQQVSKKLKYLGVLVGVSLAVILILPNLLIALLIFGNHRYNKKLNIESGRDLPFRPNILLRWSHGWSKHKFLLSFAMVVVIIFIVAVAAGLLAKSLEVKEEDERK